MRAGQGGRQLDQPEGRRGRLPRRRRRIVRRYGAGVVVMAFDEQGQADTIERKVVDLPARLRAADRSAPASIRPTSSSIRTSSRLPPASRSTTRTRSTSSRRRGSSRRPVPGVKISGGVSNLSFSFRGNDVVREAIHSGVSLPRDQGRHGHGDRQRRPADRLRGHPQGSARARRGHHLQPPA